MFVEFSILVLILAFLLSVITKKTLKGRLINGPKGLPVVGCCFEIDHETMHFKLAEYAEKFGEIYRLKILSNNIIVINSGELIRKAFGGENYKRYFGNRLPLFYGDHFRFGNQSLGFVVDGSDYFHRTARRGLVEALHTYGSGLQDLENNVMTEMTNLIRQIEDKKGEEIEFVGIIQRSLSNVLSLVLCGEVISDDDPDVDMMWNNVRGNDFFLNAFNNMVMTSFPFQRFLPGRYGDEFRRAKRSFAKVAKRYFYDLKKTYTEGKMRGIVDHYLAEQMKQKNSDTEVFFTDERIIAQIAETIDAGITTSWSILSNTMLVLLNYPEYQTKIQKELDREIGRDRVPTYSDREKCIFFQAFEMEMHRYLTVVPLLLPHLCPEHIDFEGYDIQAKSTVLANVWYVHHNPEVWGDPWKFRPERFLDDNGNLLSKKHVLVRSLMPFGYGLRKCPGEMFAKTRYFLYMSNLLQRWNFEFPVGKQKSCDPRKTENFYVKDIIRARPFFCCAKERQ